MIYEKTVSGIFEKRQNRFVALVNIDGVTETVHVKNTGRLKELLVLGAPVSLAVSDNPNRKTKYDLIAVQKPDGRFVNIDSQAANQVVKEWLLKQKDVRVKPEYTYGSSRIDFYIEQGGKKILMEVKGCTLERDGIGYFPDAPTLRGIKHLGELCRALEEGYESRIAFVIQMEHVDEVRPNAETHLQFAEAFWKARQAGVEVWFLGCAVTADSLVIDRVHIAGRFD